MKRLGAAALALALAAPAFADEAAPLSRGRAFEERGGEAIYSRVCAACHQPGGQGAEGAGVYPALAADPALASSGYVVAVLLGGLKGMPALGAMMGDQQVADIVNYVRSHFGNSYGDAVTAGDVEAARRAEAK